MDQRIKKLAGILVNYSIKVKKGSRIGLTGGIKASPLLLACYELILKKGAFPVTQVGIPGTSYLYYKNATKEQLTTFPKIAWYEAKNLDGHISIGGPTNTKELTNVDPEKVGLRRKIVKKVSDFIHDQDNWVICEYPTPALAQDAEMSVQEFEDFFFKAVLRDWKKEKKKQQKLKRLLNKTKQVRIVAPGTDLNFSILGKKAKECCGERNMPDGEVFTEPVKNSVNGKIAYSFPAIYGGREVDGIKLEFKKGKVVKAEASKNGKFLKQIITTDPGAKYVGEFGIGLNYGITKFIKEILFDEKIGGTIHLALGKAYPETGGENDSAIHWDMICDLRKKGKLYFDDKIVQEKGKFKKGII